MLPWVWRVDSDIGLSSCWEYSQISRVSFSFFLSFHFLFLILSHAWRWERQDSSLALNSLSARLSNLEVIYGWLLRFGNIKTSTGRIATSHQPTNLSHPDTTLKIPGLRENLPAFKEVRRHIGRIEGEFTGFRLGAAPGQPSLGKRDPPEKR